MHLELKRTEDLAMPELTRRSLQSAILTILGREDKVHKINLIGRPYQRGAIEEHMRLTFDSNQRAKAAAAFEELKTNRYVEPTYTDIVDPENWVAITDEGRIHLQRGLRDPIDECLTAIGAHLIELRDGMRDAANRTSPDAARHAVNAARELIDQVLKEGAPSDYQTRKDRVKFFLQKDRPKTSDSDLRIVEACCDLITAEHDKAIALSHSRGSVDPSDAILVVEATERALSLLFTSAQGWASAEGA
jgi:hypothetical protein